MPADSAPRRSWLRALVPAAIAVGVLALVFFNRVGTSSAKSLYVSTRGHDGGGCGAKHSPCGSFEGAFRRASPGENVFVEDGTYPSQTLEQGPRGASTEHVVFMPTEGSHVRVDGPLYVFGSHVTLQNMRVGDVTIGNYDQTPGRPNPIGVTLDQVSGRNFEIDSSVNVTIHGGSWGPASACGGPSGGSNNSVRDITGVDPTNISITGVTIHDVQSYDLTACHIEGLAIFAGRNVTISYSKFFGDSVYDVFVQANSGPISRLTISHNWMAMPVGTDGRQNGTVIGFSAITSNVLVEDNHFNYIISIDDDGLNPVYSNFRLIGNVGVLPYRGCSLRGITWIDNTWQRGACSKSDVNLHGRPLPYVDASNTSTLNYTLKVKKKTKKRHK